VALIKVLSTLAVVAFSTSLFTSISSADCRTTFFFCRPTNFFLMSTISEMSKEAEQFDVSRDVKNSFSSRLYWSSNRIRCQWTLYALFSPCTTITYMTISEYQLYVERYSGRTGDELRRWIRRRERRSGCGQWLPPSAARRVRWRSLSASASSQRGIRVADPDRKRIN